MGVATAVVGALAVSRLNRQAPGTLCL